MNPIFTDLSVTPWVSSVWAPAVPINAVMDITAVEVMPANASRLSLWCFLTMVPPMSSRSTRRSPEGWPPPRARRDARGEPAASGRSPLPTKPAGQDGPDTLLSQNYYCVNRPRLIVQNAYE